MRHTRANLSTPDDNPHEEADDNRKHDSAKDRTGDEIATEKRSYVQGDRDSREQADVEASLHWYLPLPKEPETDRKDTQCDPAECASMHMGEQDILAERCDMQSIEDADANGDGEDSQG